MALTINGTEENFIKELKNSYPNSGIVCDDDKNAIYIQQLKEYVKGTRREFNLPLHFIGTDFQKKVWKSLCGIPYGKVVSYKDIAEKVGNHKASRAVGMANNKNKIAIIVPCHRVIGVGGDLVGYGGGLSIKKKLLTLEGIKIVEEKVVNE
ncbi:MAG: methylated-DNA--[protein]-cysteine S-methyltransferase [Clostridiaceae bacterium]|nr:methylated-DNA--[protein]-cysteine S-methyltransferase [Clostridiaceae bacterium]